MSKALVSDQHQIVVDRFVAACRADERVVAAFLGGSNARDEADEHSDLDLCVITTDAAFETFITEREKFLRLLGEPVFVEVFGQPNVVFFVLADGTEGELYFGSQGHRDSIHSGPFKVLLDKKGILSGMTFTEETVDPAEQTETLRRLITGFWHELSHFITAMGRGQLWWAYGQLEALRSHCVSLERLRHDFSAWAGGDEPYFKIEKELPIESLAPLVATCCAREPQAMLSAAADIVHCYQELATALAQAHGLTYPSGLERVMLERLKPS